MKRIHIVSSSPRSGTTLLMELMTSSYEIDYFPEHEERIGKVPVKKAEIYLTKSPKDIVVIGSILRYVNTIYAIVIIRDPRDSAVSKHKQDPSNYYGTLEYWKNYIPFYDQIKNHHRLITVKYEDLVTNPDGIQKEISKKLPFLEKKGDFSDYIKNASPTPKSVVALGDLRKIETKSVGNWRNHKSRLKAEIIRHGSISDDLIKYGYEFSNEWEKEIEQIEPNFDQQHHSPFSKRKFIRKKRKTQFIRIIKVWIYHSPLFLLVLNHYHNIKKVLTKNKQH